MGEYEGMEWGQGELQAKDKQSRGSSDWGKPGMIGDRVEAPMLTLVCGDHGSV